MGGCCSLPDVSITHEQQNSIVEMVKNNEYFLVIKSVAPYLVPLHANKVEPKKDGDKTFQGFVEDQLMLSQHTEWPEDLRKQYSIHYAYERVPELLIPVLESTFGPELKRKLDDSIPESIKDKAVNMALKTAAEQAVKQQTRAIVDEQLKAMQ